MAPNVLLASNSPRRRELLALTGWTFTVRPVNINEDPLPEEDPAKYVLRLAESKARAAAHFAEPGQLVLAADTTVVDGALILGKPADATEARQMLRSLRGRSHVVYTAISVSDPSVEQPDGSEHLVVDLCETRVWMRGYSDAEIEAYIASGDPFDKAGAYAIQNAAFHPVERIEGCYACVVGLPVCHVVRAIAQFGITPPQDITQRCPNHLKMNTPCPVYEKIARDGPAAG